MKKVVLLLVLVMGAFVLNSCEKESVETTESNYHAIEKGEKPPINGVDKGTPPPPNG
ncbi:hypothetical protein [Flagellimonas sp.]|uniref:hypothetical protein n=1 Tax=Flagellimonas sp. TaxID=2058762 RepID=UPI003BA86B85